MKDSTQIFIEIIKVTKIPLIIITIVILLENQINLEKYIDKFLKMENLEIKIGEYEIKIKTTIQTIQTMQNDIKENDNLDHEEIAKRLRESTKILREIINTKPKDYTKSIQEE